MTTKSLADFILFAQEAHKGQFRRDGKTPYFRHCLSVMSRLINIGITNEDILMAAVGHDLLEDTQVNIADILNTSDSSEAVLRLIQELTRTDTNKKTYLQDMSLEALLIKAADAVDNANDTLDEGTQYIRKSAAKYIQYSDHFTDRLSNRSWTWPESICEGIHTLNCQLKSIIDDLDQILSSDGPECEHP